MSARSDADVRGERLLSVWRQAEGVLEVERTIHADDEMARPDLQKTDAARAPLAYMRTGLEAFRVLENLLCAAGRSFAEVRAMLDFACGYGRVLRFVVRELEPARIVASDVVRPAVDFVGSTFGVRGVYSATAPGDVALEGEFDLISVFSLFSHLPESRFSEFLRMLHGRLSPDGILFFSTLTPHAVVAAAGAAFTYLPESGIPHLDVQEYGTTYVHPERVRALCRGVGIQHVWHLERELWRIQDVYAVSKRPIAGLDAWRHAPLCRGAILRADISAAGLAFAGGYVRTPTSAPAVRDVRIRVDGSAEFPCVFARHPVGLPESEGGAHFVQTDWFVEGPARELLGGAHTVAALATLDGGRPTCFDVVELQPA